MLKTEEKDFVPRSCPAHLIPNCFCDGSFCSTVDEVALGKSTPSAFFGGAYQTSVDRDKAQVAKITNSNEKRRVP